MKNTIMQCLPQYDRDLMKKYGKVMGYFDGRHPNLWITDADLIRSIYVKDFDHFLNRRVTQLISLTKFYKYEIYYRIKFLSRMSSSEQK